MTIRPLATDEVARVAAVLGLARLDHPDAAQALYRARGYADAGIPPRRVVGTIELRTGPIEVDDTLLTWRSGYDRIAA